VEDKSKKLLTTKKEGTSERSEAKSVDKGKPNAGARDSAIILAKNY